MFDKYISKAHHFLYLCSRFIAKIKHMQAAQLSSISVNVDPMSWKTLEENFNVRKRFFLGESKDYGWIFITFL